MQRRNPITLLFLMVLLVIGAALIIGTRRYYSQNPVPTFGGSVNEGMVGQPHLLNPLFADLNPIDREFTDMIFRGLIKYNSRNQPVGNLAKEWEIKDDGKTYEVELKPELYWHDGVKITSDDVVFTYQTTQNESYDGPEKNTFEEVEIDRIDDQHVRFVLSKPFAPFLENLTLGILPAHLWESVPLEQFKTYHLNLKPIGSGNASFKKIKFTGRIQNWIDWIEFDLSASYLSSVRFKFYPTYTDLITAIKLAEIDTAILPTKEDLNKFDEWPNFVKLVYPLWGRSTYIIFNLRNEKYQNEDIRESLAAYIYNSNLGKSETSGNQQRYTVRARSPISQISWGYKGLDEKLEPSDTELPSEITIKTPHDTYYVYLAESIKNIWEEQGITVNIDLLDQMGLREAMQNLDFETLLITLESGHDPDQYIYWHSTQKEPPLLNLSGIAYARIDKSLEDGRTKLDQTEREKAYETFQNLFYRQMPAIPLQYPNLYYVASAKIKALNIRNLWSPSDRFANINDWYLREKRPLF